MCQCFVIFLPKFFILLGWQKLCLSEFVVLWGCAWAQGGEGTFWKRGKVLLLMASGHNSNHLDQIPSATCWLNIHPSFPTSWSLQNNACASDSVRLLRLLPAPQSVWSFLLWSPAASMGSGSRSTVPFPISLNPTVQTMQMKTHLELGQEGGHRVTPCEPIYVCVLKTSLSVLLSWKLPASYLLLWVFLYIFLFHILSSSISILNNSHFPKPEPSPKSQNKLWECGGMFPERRRRRRHLSVNLSLSSPWDLPPHQSIMPLPPAPPVLWDSTSPWNDPPISYKNNWCEYTQWAVGKAVEG